MITVNLSTFIIYLIKCIKENTLLKNQDFQERAPEIFAAHNDLMKNQQLSPCTWCQLRHIKSIF